MLPPTRGSHSVQGGPCHTSESCSVVLGDHSPPHPSFKAGIVPAVFREHWLPLAECPWLTDILFHLHFWQQAHELLPREAHSMPSGYRIVNKTQNSVVVVIGGATNKSQVSHKV